MKRFFFALLFFLLNVPLLLAQPSHFVTAKNGLNLRTAPNIDAEKIVKLPYGFEFYLLDQSAPTSVLNVDGVVVKGRWVKIEFYHPYFFITSDEEKLELDQYEGYVFDAYIQPYVEKEKYYHRSGLGEEYFRTLTKMADTLHPTWAPARAVQDFDSINELINHSITWYKIIDSVYTIESAQLPNGWKFSFTPNNTETSFNLGESNYYPDFNILEMSGGHQMDICFNVKTGEFQGTCGNPRYTIKSPNDKYRLTGWFGGQECISYFFQQRIGDEITYFYCPSWMDNICLFEEFYWLSDTEFIYSTMNYEYGEMEYFAGKIEQP